MIEKKDLLYIEHSRTKENEMEIFEVQRIRYFNDREKLAQFLRENKDETKLMESRYTEVEDNKNLIEFLKKISPWMSIEDWIKKFL